MTDTEIVSAFYDDFNARRLDACVASLAPDVVWREPYAERDESFVGREAVRTGVLEFTISVWPDAAMHLKETLVLSTGQIVVIGESTATHGETRETYCIPFFHTWEVRGGVIATYRHFNDPESIRRVIEGRIVY